jgi:hypothetical protein
MLRKNRVSDADIGAALGAIVVLALIAGFIYGWVANIVSIVQAIDNPVTGMLVLRGVGVFVAPLGAVLGYF